MQQFSFFANLRTHPGWPVIKWREKDPSQSWNSDGDHDSSVKSNWSVFWNYPSFQDTLDKTQMKLLHSLFHHGWALISEVVKTHFIKSFQEL